MTKRFCLELPTPATGFMDSFMLGNGRLGATVAGGIGTEWIDINLDCLWSGGPEGEPKGASPAHLLPELRQAIAAGDSAGADRLSRQMQGEGWTQSYQPLGVLNFAYADAQDAPGYHRQLDLEMATAEHGYGQGDGAVRLRSFVCTSADVAVVLAEGAGLLSPAEMSIAWECQHPVERAEWVEGGVRWVRIMGRAPSMVIPPYIEADDAIVYAEDAPDADGSVAAGMGFAGVAALSMLTDGTARVVIAAECGFRGAFERPSANLAELGAQAEMRVRVALQRPVAELYEAHVAEHRRYFDRAGLELAPQPELGASDPARAELLYHFGRYLLIASSRPGTEPANLQGIWNPYRRPAWSSNYTANINAQMNYWPAQACGLGDLAEPEMRLIAELVEAGRASAKHYYGAPGSVTHHNTDLWRFTRPVEGDPNWANWTAALPWLLAHGWDHWDYGSADDAFARDSLLPMLEEAARFVLFMLTEDNKGALVVSPSSSPENSFVGPDGRAWGVAAGAAMDQELCLELFGRLVVLSRRFERQSDVADPAAKALTRLRRPDAGATGALQEWAGHLADAEPGHRHLSHLYGLYPGDRIHPIIGGPDVAAARRALEERLSHGTGHTGWSQSWVLCLAARLGEAARCDDAVATLLTKLTTRALLVLHPYDNADGAVFQIDGNFGATAGIGEMLLQSIGSTILLLPALPGHWDQGRFIGFRARGGHEVDLAWVGGAISAGRVVAGRDEWLTLDLLDGGDTPIVLTGDEGDRLEAVAAAGRPGRCTIAWQAKRGAQYRLGPAQTH